jgi:hypothetical protein
MAGIQLSFEPALSSAPQADALWIPAHLLWGYLTGAVLLFTGLGLTVNKKARLAAKSIGLMILVVVLFVYVPIVVANPSAIGNGLNYLVDTLLLSGSALAFAGTVRGQGATHPHE